MLSLAAAEGHRSVLPLREPCSAGYSPLSWCVGPGGARCAQFRARRLRESALTTTHEGRLHLSRCSRPLTRAVCTSVGAHDHPRERLLEALPGGTLPDSARSPTRHGRRPDSGVGRNESRHWRDISAENRYRSSHLPGAMGPGATGLGWMGQGRAGPGNAEAPPFTGKAGLRGFAEGKGYSLSPPVAATASTLVSASSRASGQTQSATSGWSSPCSRA